MCGLMLSRWHTTHHRRCWSKLGLGFVLFVSVGVLSCRTAVIHLQAEILVVHATGQDEYTAFGVETPHAYVDNAVHGALWTDAMPLVPPGTSLGFVSCGVGSDEKTKMRDVPRIV